MLWHFRGADIGAQTWLSQDICHRTEGAGDSVPCLLLLGHGVWVSAGREHDSALGDGHHGRRDLIVVLGQVNEKGLWGSRVTTGGNASARGRGRGERSRGERAHAAARQGTGGAGQHDLGAPAGAGTRL